MPNITANVSLATYTTFKIGGLASQFAIAKTQAELQGLINFANSNGLAILILGGGSNVLISEAGFDGLVIKLELAEIEYKNLGDETLVKVGAGVVLDDLIQESIEKNLWGLENLSHIPGSVGATPVQNVGAYGVEVSDLITSVEVFNIEKNILEVLTNEQCVFGYRDSVFKNELKGRCVVTSVTFKLSSQPNLRLDYKDLANHFLENKNPSLEEIRQAVIAIRSQKFPDWRVVGTAGSFFKNPIIDKAHYEALVAEYPELPGYIYDEEKVKVPLGWILDKVCNLRGYRLGDVGTYEGQSLVVVNFKDATAEEVKNFVAGIEEKVFSKTKIKIQWEVTLV